MTQAFVLILVGVTSILAIVIGVWGLGLRLPRLKPATGKALECIGLMFGFFALNLAIGMASILVWRQLTHTFLSLYALSDVALLGLSLCQGLIFQWWRNENRASKM
jgi:hypothetical protein